MAGMFRRTALFAASLALAGCSLLPESSGTAAPQRKAGGTGLSITLEAGQCLALLGQTGSRFSPVPDKYFGAGCSTINTVRLADLRSDASSVGLSNLGPVACPVANSFAGWARFGVDRAARQILGSPLVRIETMGSYSCRNVAGSNRRSAHSRAEAIDVAAFILADGRRISLTDHWNKGNARERQFLRTAFTSACKRFGTVLGPEYNAAHLDHFHLERTVGSSAKTFCR